MDVLQMEVDFEAALLVLRKADLNCLLNKYAERVIDRASTYLRGELYGAMQAYFADPDPDPAPEEVMF